MKSVPQVRVDKMGELNNAITEAIDKSACTTLEVVFILEYIKSAIQALALAPKKEQVK